MAAVVPIAMMVLGIYILRQANISRLMEPLEHAWDASDEVDPTRWRDGNENVVLGPEHADSDLAQTLAVKDKIDKDISKATTPPPSKATLSRIEIENKRKQQRAQQRAIQEKALGQAKANMSHQQKTNDDLRRSLTSGGSWGPARDLLASWNKDMERDEKELQNRIELEQAKTNLVNQKATNDDLRDSLQSSNWGPARDLLASWEPEMQQDERDLQARVDGLK